MNKQAFLQGYLEKSAGGVLGPAKGIVGLVNKFKKQVLTPRLMPTPEEISAENNFLASKGYWREPDFVVDPKLNAKVVSQLSGPTYKEVARDKYQLSIDEALAATGKLPDDVGPEALKSLQDKALRSRDSFRANYGNAAYYPDTNEIGYGAESGLWKFLKEEGRAGANPTDTLAHEVLHSVHQQYGNAARDTNMNHPLKAAFARKFEPLMGNLAPAEKASVQAYDALHTNPEQLAQEMASLKNTFRSHRGDLNEVYRTLMEQERAKFYTQAVDAEMLGSGLEGKELRRALRRSPISTDVGGQLWLMDKHKDALKIPEKMFHKKFQNKPMYYKDDIVDEDVLAERLSKVLAKLGVSSAELKPTVTRILNSPNRSSVLVDEYKKLHRGRREGISESGVSRGEEYADTGAVLFRDWLSGRKRQQLAAQIYDARLRKAGDKTAWRQQGRPLPSNAPQLQLP